MIVRRRPLVFIAASCAVAVFGMVACSKNEVSAPGLDSEILVESSGPQGTAPALFGPYAWAVNTIDSIQFVENIDSTRLEVTSLRVTDPQGQTVPGEVRYLPDSTYVAYTQTFPSNEYTVVLNNPPLSPKFKKVYFIPSQPLHGHTEYTCRLSTGIRMIKGTLVRDEFNFSFVTGDSVAPPVAAR